MADSQQLLGEEKPPQQKMVGKLNVPTKKETKFKMLQRH